MPPPDQDKPNTLLGRMVGDPGAIGTGALVLPGDRLGRFKAMMASGPMTAADLAAATKTHERSVREWLFGQAAAGYFEYDAGADRFFLSSGQAPVFADKNSPAFMRGAFEVVASLWIDEPKVGESFRTGKGMGWHDRSACLFRGTERFFRPGYNANLAGLWLPALDGVVEKLERGARAADVGLGHGPHPGCPFPGSRTGSGRPGRGDDAAPDRNGGRLHPVSPCHRDALQHGAESASLTSHRRAYQWKPLLSKH